MIRTGEELSAEHRRKQASARRDDDASYSSLPEKAPLAMPVQAIRGWHGLRNHHRRNWADMLHSPDAKALLLRRATLILLTMIPAAIAFGSLNAQFAVGGFTLLEVGYLVLFTALFAWITFGFVTSLAGLVLLLRGHFKEHDERSAFAPPEGRTAILMPVYNEEFGPVLDRIARMCRSFEGVSGRRLFEFFILSDSGPEAGALEARGYRAMKSRFTLPVHYRRRPANIGRKPGNIADWVESFGADFEYMIVLDADSLMSGTTMARLSSEMDAQPHVGLIQTVPQITNAGTLFARWHQFAARLYGPVGTAGLIWWSNSDGTFWGHNAIVRVGAFATSCGLPKLRGFGPFGGHIMSHDMVEAALLRRRGWAVNMVMIDGSFEEFPPSLTDLAIRDRRWCQGNLQHIPLIFATGFHLVNRFHLLIGASAYITSPLWLCLIGIVLAGEASGQSLGVMSANNLLLWMTIALLLGPKLFGLAWNAKDERRRAAFGGGLAMTGSIVLETLLSMLMAPITMITQTIDIVGILAGRKSLWNGQVRDCDSMPLRMAAHQYRHHVIAGLVLVALGWGSTMTLLWLSPVIAGLLGSPLIAWATARKDFGNWLSARGLFRVPPTVLHPKDQELTITSMYGDRNLTAAA